MLFYATIFILSIGGIVAIIRRRREEFASFNFANFMENLTGDFAALWRLHLRERSFLFLEKRLRNIRILFLKMERLLFNAVHKLRGIKEKNGQNWTSGGTNSNSDTPA